MRIGIGTGVTAPLCLKPGQTLRSIFKAADAGFWFDPSVRSSLSQNAAGTLPVTMVGQPVGRIADRSGNGAVASQSSAAARPTYARLPAGGRNSYRADPDTAAAVTTWRLSVGSAGAPSAPDADLTQFRAADNSAFSVFGAGAMVGESFGTLGIRFPVVTRNGTLSGSNLGTNLHAVDGIVGFRTNANRVAFRVDGSYLINEQLRFFVDGKLVSIAEPTAVSPGRRWLTIDIGAGTKEVLFRLVGGGYFLGCALPATATCEPLAKPFRAVVLGDSFTTGAGGPIYGFGYVHYLRDLLGMLDMWPSGLGGTGYAATNGGTYYSLPQRIAADLGRATALGPVDVVIVAMGINDIGMAGVQTAAEGVVGSIRALAPGAAIYLIGPFDVAAPAAPSASYLSTKAAIQAAAIGDRTYFVDMQGVSFTKSDGTHPDALGHKTLGLHLASALQLARADITETGKANRYALLDDLGDDSLTVSLPAGTYTVAYADDAGVKVLTGQAVSGAYTLPGPVRLYGALGINRSLTGPETTKVTAWLSGRGP